MAKNMVNKFPESFEKIPRRFYILKAIGKVIGAIFVFFGFLIIILSYAVTYFIEGASNPDLIFLSTFAIGWIILGSALLVCLRVSILSLPTENQVTKYLEKYYQTKEPPQKVARFFSLRVSRLFAALFLLILGFLDLFILTGKISHHQPPYGNAVFLGGPSFYYVVAFFPHAFGLGFLLYVFFKSHRVNIASSENYLYYNEFTKTSFINADIPKTEIEAVSYQNNYVGINYLWLLLLVPFLVITAINGVYLLRAPLLETPIQGILLVTTSILELPALFYVLLKPSNFLKITTKKNYYESWFVPYNVDLREIPLPKPAGKAKKNSEFMTSHNISPTHRSYIGLVLGLIFLISGLLMLTLYYIIGIFGHLYTMVSILFGTMLIVRAIMNDFSDKNGVHIDYNDSNKSLSFKQDFRSHFMRINVFQLSGLEVTNSSRKINLLDFLLIPILIGESTIQTILSWVTTTTPNLIQTSVITTVFLGVIYFLFFLYLCLPSSHLRLRTPTLSYDIPVTLAHQKKRFLSGILAKDLRRSFILRCCFIALIGILSAIGILIYLNLNFFV